MSAPPAPSPLALTGERTLPGIPDENYWFQRHVVAYRLATAAAAGRAVLDAGCGEGYGLGMLARAGATRAIGADLDATVVAHARRAYADGDDRVEVHACELMALPLRDGAVDLTVSFQVIEHMHDIPGYLASLRRVTRPGGEVWIATPNRLTFTPGSDTPVNPFHTREFTADELRDELTAAGLVVGTVLGVHHGRRLRAVEAATGTPLPERLGARDPAGWPGWLRRVVHRVTPDHFTVHDRDPDGSLDLLATCRVPRA
jgi:SAM-dependent methyltransferase